MVWYGMVWYGMAFILRWVSELHLYLGVKDSGLWYGIEIKGKGLEFQHTYTHTHIHTHLCFVAVAEDAQEFKLGSRVDDSNHAPRRL